MATTGVKVADECIDVYNALKLKETHRYIVYKIDIKKLEIVLETTGERDETYEEFVAALPENEPRYAVCDFKYTTEDGRSQDKLVFFNWSPDTAAGMQKMVYAGSKDALRRKLTGIQKEIQANDEGYLNHAEVVKQM